MQAYRSSCRRRAFRTTTIQYSVWKADSGFSSFCVWQKGVRLDTPCENRVLQRRNISARYQLFDTDRHRTLRAPSSNSSAVRDLQSISDPLSFRESSLTVPSACNAPSRIVRAYKKYKSEILLVANCCVIILIRRDDSPPVQKKPIKFVCTQRITRIK